MNHETRLKRLVTDNRDLMSMLRCARDCTLPDWFIGGGIIRSLVWDALHHFHTPTPIRDVDVIFFDPAALHPSQELRFQQLLQQRMPTVPWQVKNQAAVHLWYEKRFGLPAEPLRSSCDAISTWPETATSVGIRITDTDDLLVAAPCGLNDLFDMALRRNPRRVTPEIFERRLRDKRFVEKWPRVRVIHENTPTDVVAAR